MKNKCEVWIILADGLTFRAPGTKFYESLADKRDLRRWAISQARQKINFATLYERVAAIVAVDMS